MPPPCPSVRQQPLIFGMKFPAQPLDRGSPLRRQARTTRRPAVLVHVIHRLERDSGLRPTARAAYRGQVVTRQAPAATCHRTITYDCHRGVTVSLVSRAAPEGKVTLESVCIRSANTGAPYVGISILTPTCRTTAAVQRLLARFVR